MNINHAFPSNYISAGDLGGVGGNGAIVTIKEVRQEEVGRSKEMCPVLFFSDAQKGLVLNKTNANSLAEMFGGETDRWAGQQIGLYCVDTEYEGRHVEGVRVRSAMASGGNAVAMATQELGATLADSGEIPF